MKAASKVVEHPRGLTRSLDSTKEGLMPNRTCRIDGCDRPAARTYLMCSAHRARWLRHGDVMAHVPIKTKRPGAKCSIDGCGKPAAARTWCEMHYTRWLRQGDPGEAAERFTVTCTFQGCKRPHRGNGLCNTHGQQLKNFGKLSPIWGPGSNRWLDIESLDYDYAHDRVVRARGSASTHECDQCGDVAAQDWAYDHCDVRQLTDERGRHYSSDITRYRPMCRSCHKRFDLWVRGRAAMVEHEKGA